MKYRKLCLSTVAVIIVLLCFYLIAKFTARSCVDILGLQKSDLPNSTISLSLFTDNGTTHLELDDSQEDAFWEQLSQIRLVKIWMPSSKGYSFKLSVSNTQFEKISSITDARTRCYKIYMNGKTSTYYLLSTGNGFNELAKPFK